MPEVPHFATAEQRAVLTLNRRDFIRLHQHSLVQAGIIVCSFDPVFSAQAGRIHQAIAADDDLTGKLLRVNRPQ